MTDRHFRHAGESQHPLLVWTLVFASVTMLLFTFMLPALAMEAVEQLPNAAQEARARTLFKDIRCVVCQAESIDESPALLAADMRAFVRNGIAAGQEDTVILNALRQRYGDKVLMTPPWRWDTALLWLAPLILLMVGSVFWLRQGSKKV